MKTRLCYLFIFEGFADWEPALISAVLNKYTDFEVRTFSLNGNPVRSLGNLQVTRDESARELKLDKASLLVLPGGDAWEQHKNQEAEPVINYFKESNKTIASICAATYFLSSRGYLNNIKHTSNGLDYLKDLNNRSNGNYRGEQLYVNGPCVVDGNIITANGAAMIEFTSKILDHFNLMDPEQRLFFYKIYKNAGILQESYN